MQLPASTGGRWGQTQLLPQFKALHSRFHGPCCRLQQQIGSPASSFRCSCAHRTLMQRRLHMLLLHRHLLLNCFSGTSLTACRSPVAARQHDPLTCRQPAVQMQAVGLNGSSGAATAAVFPHQPLAEGEQRHVLSVFVADEAGLIHQVSRVFTEAGAAVGCQWSATAVLVESVLDPRSTGPIHNMCHHCTDHPMLTD